FRPGKRGACRSLWMPAGRKVRATAETATNPAGTGPCSAFSNFIKNGANCPGTCSQLSLTNGPFEFNFAENDVALYAQDDWRIKSNLTINLGLRWEWDQQAINLLHDISVKNVQDGFWKAGFPASIT